jgi:hypothetical protein
MKGFLLLAASDNIWGKVEAPVKGLDAEPTTILGNTISFASKFFILIAVFAMLIYLLLGAFDWIVSNGEKEKLTKAQNKITNAIVGLLIVIVVLVIFGYVTGDILHIITKTDSGWSFNLPTLGN